MIGTINYFNAVMMGNTVIISPSFYFMPECSCLFRMLLCDVTSLYLIRR